MNRPITLLLPFVKQLSAVALLLSCAVAGNGQTPHRRFPNIGIGTRTNPHDSTRVANVSVGLFGHVDSIRGLQLNLISSGAGMEMRGAQISGVASFSGRVRGLQMAPISCVTVSPLRGVQIAGATNIAMGLQRGAMVAGLANICPDTIRGLQWAAFNYAESMNGVQIGVVNVAGEHPKGTQIGLVNFSRDNVGRKFGLVNINPTTQIDLMAFGGTSSKLNLAFRFRNRSTYSMIGFGTHYMGFDGQFSGALYYRLGQYFDLSPRWSVSADVGFYHVETFKKNEESNPSRLYSLQLHVNVDYRINRLFGLYVSTGYGDTRYYRHAEAYRNRALVEGGLFIRYR